MPKVDAHLRAEFREIARLIVRADLDAKKRGLSQNTIGKIEQAMVSAFATGRDGLWRKRNATEATSDILVDWIEIPSRARETLISMTFVFSKVLGAQIGPADLVKTMSGGAIRWAFIDEMGVRERTVANGSVSPLIRMRLIAPVESDNQRFALLLVRRGG